jgi:hypothetical protein
MTSRPWLFLGAATILIFVRIYLSLTKRRGHPFFESANEPSLWTPYQLLIASFLTPFAELAFIRWIAVEIRVFACFKNLALLLCFVGFGLLGMRALLPITLAICCVAALALWRRLNRGNAALQRLFPGGREYSVSKPGSSN